MTLLPLYYMDLRRPVSPTVVATDASREGGGVVLSDGLSARGRSWMSQQIWSEAVSPTEPVVLVDLFAGIGVARLALENLGVHVQRHIVVEDDKHALRV
eukprot:553761-Amphidinium_carterae.1